MDLHEKRPKKKPTKIEDMTKEQIRQTILKKRECNAKALSIVESLLEKDVTESYFLQCLPDINQSHLEDIIEERSITKLCGYPLCSEIISEKDIPKQKYRISVKTNKVYDISARKSFCSNTCYESAMYVKKQMLSSPLCFREYEEIPEFQLPPLNSTGSMGREVDLSIIVKLNVQNEQSFTSINDFTSASLNDLPPNTDIKLNIGNVNSAEENNSPGVSNNSQHASTNNNSNDVSKTDLSGPQNDNNCKLATKSSKEPNIEQKATEKKIASNPLNIVGDIVEKPEKSIDPILSQTIDNKNNSIDSNATAKVIKKKRHSITAVIVEVEKCLAEWFTLDTLLFLFGEEKVKEMVADKGDCIKEYLNNYANGLFYSANSYDQYQRLCRKLNMLELEDRRYNNSDKRNTKPLPDYSILKEESKKMQLKVKAFLSGQTVITEHNTTDNEQISTDNENLTQLPLVDKNSQRFLRRKIVSQHLNKVLPDLLQSLGLLALSTSSDVRLLVNTFKLQANNIMFKPIQWTLIAIVIIKLLSIRDKRLEYLLERKTAYEHMQLLLLSYKQDGGYLERLISWLTDVDRLLDVNDTQLTIQ